MSKVIRGRKLVLHGSPEYSFFGGAWYDTSPQPTTESLYSAKSYSGENYAYFRIYKAVQDGNTYLSTIYANLPMAIFQYKNEAIGIEFHPLLEGKPLSFAVWSDEGGVSVDFRGDVTHVLREKRRGHLGDWECEKEFTPGTTADQVSIVSGQDWMDLVRAKVEANLRDDLSLGETREAMLMAVAFYDRTYDSDLAVHADTVLPSAPRVYPDPIYNYPSFESCRLAALARVGIVNADRLSRIADRLMDEESSVELKELGDVRVWHNALMLRDIRGVPEYGTGYGTGYSGWPGGMAYTIRGLIEYCMTVGRSDKLGILRSGLNWFLAIQLPDGGFPFNVPTFIDCKGARGRCFTGPRSRAVGGAAEAIRALCAGYRLFGDERYLQAAQKGAKAINPQPPYYAFRGYGDLRDAGDYESDATSGYSLGSANLDLYELTGDRSYLDVAKALGYYTLTWHFWWSPGPEEILGLIDPVAESFSPHASPWNTALAADFYGRLYRYTLDKFWLRTARYVYAQCIRFQNKASGGISEAYPMKMDGSYTDMGGESAMVTWAIIVGGSTLLTLDEATADLKGVIVRPENVNTSCVRAVSVFAELEVSKLCHSPIDRMICTGKRILKGVLRKSWKSLPRPLAAKIRERVKSTGDRMFLPERAGRKSLVVLKPGDSADGFTLSVDIAGDVIRSTLRSSRYSVKVERVLMPVLTFPSSVVRFIATRTIGDTIVSGDVETESGVWYEVSFLEGTTGLGASGVILLNGALAFDVTLKALWEHCGICTQYLAVHRKETGVEGD